MIQVCLIVWNMVAHSMPSSLPKPFEFFRSTVNGRIFRKHPTPMPIALTTSVYWRLREFAKLLMACFLIYLTEKFLHYDLIVCSSIHFHLEVSLEKVQCRLLDELAGFNDAKICCSNSSSIFTTESSKTFS